jgi:hypothetical protein
MLLKQQLLQQMKQLQRIQQKLAVEQVGDCLMSSFSRVSSVVMITKNFQAITFFKEEYFLHQQKTQNYKN